MIRFAVALLAFVLVACATPRAPSPIRPDSVVTLLQPAPPPTCIGFPEEKCRYAYSYEPHCAAFAIARQGQTMLATASHCVPADTANTTRLHFYAPSGWGHGHAYLLERDAAADVAFLALGDPELVTPLRMGKSPLVGESVWSYSPIYRERSEGLVTGWLGGEWLETSQTIAKGWSGSPVLDAGGDVVGVVSQCPGDTNGATVRCAPGRAVVTSALCFGAH
jgi:hypothetical protein